MPGNNISTDEDTHYRLDHACGNSEFARLGAAITKIACKGQLPDARVIMDQGCS